VGALCGIGAQNDQIDEENLSHAVARGMLCAKMPGDREVMECGSEGQSMQQCGAKQWVTKQWACTYDDLLVPSWVTRWRCGRT
jgi:hypothetical protein